MPNDRAQAAYRVRLEAAELASRRHHPEHASNPDEQRYAAAHYPMSFTKGLKHDDEYGVVMDPQHFEVFRHAIDNGHIVPFTADIPVPISTELDRRQWEAPTAGIVYDLQGPDAQAVTMAPAPALGSDELDFEMAEVYELALVRDTAFLSFDQNGGAGSTKLNAAAARLEALPYFEQIGKGVSRPRTLDANGGLGRQVIFRGSSPGVENGPYLSQFLWIGTDDQNGGGGPASGRITYGAQTIDQRVLVAEDSDDYLQDWDSWLRVQNGFDVNACSGGQTFLPKRRFIYTPRDLATYVHFDALYQAYLNAVIILLGMRTPFDPGFAHLAGMRSQFGPMTPNPGMHEKTSGGKRTGDNGAGREQLLADVADLHHCYQPITNDPVMLNAGGFALFGGPHILTLVTEVATRALKAVRYQKFNNHLRLRPEALAARVHKAEKLDGRYPVLCGAFGRMRDQIDATVKAIETFNEETAETENADAAASALLPMAFMEGSPMHPTYGAGHATVAGACVTIVKAFFDTSTVMGTNADKGCTKARVGFYRNVETPKHFEARDSGGTLEEFDTRDVQHFSPLTLEGELNKLAANISIGRNMAGVHFYSDYYDSLRMGEAIAVGLLEEQALCYPTDGFVMSIPTFDGGMKRIGRK